MQGIFLSDPDQKCQNQLPPAIGGAAAKGIYIAFTEKTKQNFFKYCFSAAKKSKYS